MEPWESEITVEDLFDYVWDYAPNKKNVVDLLNIYREKYEVRFLNVIVLCTMFITKVWL